VHDRPHILGGLPPGVIEIGRHGDHNQNVLDGGAEEGLNNILHLGI